MPEHYTRNTEEATRWCNACNARTQHAVSDGRLGRCLEHDAEVLAAVRAKKCICGHPKTSGAAFCAWCWVELTSGPAAEALARTEPLIHSSGIRFNRAWVAARKFLAEHTSRLSNPATQQRATLFSGDDAA
jgi:hypothetical protein